MATQIPLKLVTGGLSQYSATDTVPVANLGTGVADDTAYLRGDGAWVFDLDLAGGARLIRVVANASSSLTIKASGGSYTKNAFVALEPNATTPVARMRADNGSAYGELAAYSDGTFAVVTNGGGTVTFANSTGLNAGALGYGTVPTARLGSGTANSTTFLRGDNTWQTVSASGFAVNVKDYGAVGDGSADDYAEIAAAIADAVSLGKRRVYFPQGIYRITSELAISGDMMLFGDGPSTSIIKVDHAGHGVNFTGVLGALENEKLTVAHLGFRANNANCVAAILGQWTTPLSGLVAAVPSCLISDVEIGASSASAGFDYGIVLDTANHGQIEKVSFYGVVSGGVPSGTVGILLGSGNYLGDWVTATLYSAGQRVRSSNVVYRCLVAHTSGTFATDLANGKWINASTTDFKIKDCTLHYAETGIKLVDCEGVHINQTTILSCLYGITAYAFSSVGKPYLDITGNHFNIGKFGILVYGMTQFVIGDNLIYGDQRTPNADTYFAGVYIDNTPLGSSGVELQSFIRDNIVAMVDESVSGYSSMNRGFTVVGASGAYESIVFDNNRSQACDHLIYLDSNTAKAVITETNLGTSGETWSDNGTGNSLPFGKYSPSGVTGTNCTTANVYADVQWDRTGNTVTVVGQIDAAPTSTASGYQFFIPLPVASALTSATSLSGVLSPSGANAPGGAFIADVTNDRAECNVYSPTTGAIRYSFVFRYPVI